LNIPIQPTRHAHEHASRDRALSIYETLADRSAIKGTRERLSKHLMKIYLEAKRPAPADGARLSYLRNFDRDIDARN